MDFFATKPTNCVAAGTVRDWARQAICGWFTGRDEGFDEATFQQWEVSKLPDGSYRFLDPVTGRVHIFDVAVVVVERNPA